MPEPMPPLPLGFSELFDGERATARRQLSARWRASGLTAGRTIAEQAEWSSLEFPNTHLSFPSPDRPSKLSLRDLWSRARNVAESFDRLGVGVGDVVAVALPNWSEAVITYVASAALGAVVLPIVHTYGTADIDWIIGRVRPRILVVPQRWNTIDYLERLTGMPSIASVEHVVVVGDRAPDGAVLWKDLEHADGTNRRPARVDADEPFLVTFTSGTTAAPKGIVHSHDSFLAELRTMPSPPHLSEPLRVMQPWPAGHIGGMTAILGPLVHGFDTVLLDRWDTDTVVDILTRERISAASGVPTALLWLIDAIEAAGVEVPLRELTTGGAGIPSTLIERGAALGWHIGRCYGSSEHPSATVCVRSDTLEHRLHSDGAPMEGTEVRILRDDGTDCDVGEAGEVALIGPEQFLGYTDPVLNRELITPDGWLLTGDIGVLDGDGYLTITDRKKDLIIRGGENISSVEVEEILARHPAIAEAAVVASPDPAYGERVCAFVVVRPGHRLELDDVRRHFEEAEVQRQKTPELLYVVGADELPRTAAGKVRKPALRELVDDRTSHTPERS